MIAEEIRFGEEWRTEVPGSWIFEFHELREELVFHAEFEHSALRLFEKAAPRFDFCRPC